MAQKQYVTSVINTHLVKTDLEEKNQAGVIAELANLLEKEHKISSVEGFVEDVQDRERGGTTNLEFGVAVPHARSAYVNEAALAFGKSEGISWNESASEPVQLVFLLAVPEKNANKQHIKILSTLSRMLLNENFRRKLLEAGSADQVIQAIEEVIIDK